VPEYSVAVWPKNFAKAEAPLEKAAGWHEGSPSQAFDNDCAPDQKT
jgi:hypothetical protein